MAARAAQLDRLLARVEEAVAALALALAVTLSIAGVLLRYLFDYVIYWGEEASLFLVILSTFVGASIALRHNEHVGVDLLGQLTRGWARRAVRLVAALVVLVYAALFCGLGWLLVTSPQAAAFETPALDLPLWLPQLAIPLGLTLLLVRSLQIVYRTVRGSDPYPDASGGPLEGEAAP